MAGDERNGDDLFEDLDKFFAPIKDVDWEEPASTGGGEPPSEEHVSVRSEPSEAPASAEPAVSRAPEQGGGGDEPAPDDDLADDEEWYDTSVLETIEGIGTDDEADAGDADRVVAVGEADDEEEIGQEVVGEAPQPGPGQAGLFSGDEPAEGDDAGAGWTTDGGGDEGEYAEATLVGDEDDLDTETAPIATIDELMGDVESPDDEDLEQATEYFAPSVRAEAGMESDVAGGEGSVGWDDGSTVSPDVGGTLIGELGPD